jgi:hypothetical protein
MTVTLKRDTGPVDALGWTCLRNPTNLPSMDMKS